MRSEAYKMATVYVQVGQCGNQIGQQLWTQVLPLKDTKEGMPFFNMDEKLRSVHVDSEPKVLRRLGLALKKKNLEEANLIAGKRGRGTNWALGYHGVRRSEGCMLLGQTVEAVRREVEQCDCFSGMVVMHSLSGGTGSGLGAHVIENLKDHFPIPYLMSVAVAPHAGGESPLQHYNCLLCLSWVQQYTDAILLFNNDDVLYQVQHQQNSSKAQVSIPEMNQYISNCLAGLFLPTDSITPTPGIPLGMEPWELLRSVCPMPATKFAQVSHHMGSRLGWDAIAAHAIQMYRKQHSHRDRALSAVVVARGSSKDDFRRYKPGIERKVRAGCNSVEWNPFPLDFWTDKNSLSGRPEKKSLTLCTNNSGITGYLEHVLTKARQKYDAKAFLHWYWKHGCTDQDFSQAFDTVGKIVEDYKEAVR
ncbi:tubulin delta chain-like isoform X1 [Branchiostoma floridae x Branchiostoma japonicum]